MAVPVVVIQSEGVAGLSTSLDGNSSRRLERPHNHRRRAAGCHGKSESSRGVKNHQEEGQKVGVMEQSWGSLAVPKPRHSDISNTSLSRDAFPRNVPECVRIIVIL